jgi:ProP effector
MHPDETAAPPPAPSAPGTADAPEASPAAPPTEPTAPPEEQAPPGGTNDQTEPGLSPAECGTRLAALFPALFVAPGAPGPFKPIKLRIHADILTRAPGVFSKRVLGIFFSRYTTSGAYLKALAAPDAQRFDLDGQPAGEIAEEHRAAALEELARRHTIAAERRAAQRRAVAPPAPITGGPAPGDAAPRPTHERSHDRNRDRKGAPPRDDRHGLASARPRRDDRARPEQAPRSAPHAAPRRDAQARPQHQGAAAPATPALPADPAARERALLLRAFESSPLSKPNFCVLKRISEAELDTLLDQARAERR